METLNGKLTQMRRAHPWIQFIATVLHIMVTRRVSGYAQQIAYNAVFATAPLLMVITAGAAFLARTINQHAENPAKPILEWMQERLPAEAADFLSQPVDQAINASPTWILSVGGGLALWGGRGMMSTLMRGVNQAHGVQRDPRSWIAKTALSLAFVPVLVVQIAVAGFVFTLGTDWGQRLADNVGFGTAWSVLSGWMRWSLLVLIVMTSLAAFYKYSSALKRPFRWHLPGAVIAVAGASIATRAMSYWLGQSQSFASAYGVFGTVLIYIVWLYVMAMVLLIGSVVNIALPGREDHLPV